MSDPGVPQSGTLIPVADPAPPDPVLPDPVLPDPVLPDYAELRRRIPALRRCRTVVRAFCAQAGLLYCEKGLVSSYSDVLRHLHAAGRR